MITRSEITKLSPEDQITKILMQSNLIEGLKPLARLGVEAMAYFGDGRAFHGAIIHATAVKFELLIKTKFDPAKHKDWSDIGTNPGDLWFEFPPAVMAAKRALEEEE